eukprot:gene4780-6704_t
MQSLQQKQLEDKKIREILNGETDIKNSTEEERVARMEMLQYEQHQHLFGVMYTTIHKAASDNSISGIKYFLSLNKRKKIHIDEFDSHGLCAIHLAAERGHNDSISFLIKSGSDVNVGTKFENTPIMYACKENRVSTIRLLLELGANLKLVNNAGFSALHFAGQGNHPESIQEIINYYQELEIKRLQDIEDGVISVAQDTVADGSSSVLHSYGNQSIISSNESQSMVYGHSHGHGHSGLMDSSYTTELINLLNTRSKNGTTPLHMACMSNSYQAVSLLINQRGVVIDVFDGGHETPLHKAGRINSFQIYRALQSKGAVESIKNSLGETPKKLLHDDTNY